jgi:anthranilate phosphoribosyltransferase
VLLAHALRSLGRSHALVVTGPGGLDEIGLDGPTHGYDVRPDGVEPLTIDPVSLGLAPADIGELAGGDADRNAGHLREILGGASGPRRDVVLVNAAAALVAADRAPSIADGLELARRSIDEGEAARRLDTLIRVSQAEVA